MDVESKTGKPNSPLIISSPLTLTINSERRKYGCVCWIVIKLHSLAGNVMLPVIEPPTAPALAAADDDEDAGALTVVVVDDDGTVACCG